MKLRFSLHTTEHFRSGLSSVPAVFCRLISAAMAYGRQPYAAKKIIFGMRNKFWMNHVVNFSGRVNFFSVETAMLGSFKRSGFVSIGVEVTDHSFKESQSHVSRCLFSECTHTVQSRENKSVDPRDFSVGSIPRFGKTTVDVASNLIHLELNYSIAGSNLVGSQRSLNEGPISSSKFSGPLSKIHSNSTNSGLIHYGPNIFSNISRGSSLGYIGSNFHTLPMQAFPKITTPPLPFGLDNRPYISSKLGSSHRKSFSFKESISESILYEMDFREDDCVDNDGIESSFYDPSLEEIYGSHLKNHLIKSLACETPIKGFSIGPRINFQASSHATFSLHHSPNSYIDALSASPSSPSPLLVKNSSPSSDLSSKIKLRGKGKGSREPIVDIGNVLHIDVSSSTTSIRDLASLDYDSRSTSSQPYTMISGGAGNNTAVKLIRCKDNERQALLDFKKEIVEDEFGFLSSWGSQEEDCCKWRGIRCSNTTGHVILLHLHGWYDYATDNSFHLSGKVSPSLLELNHLKYLDLSYNDFYPSPIPEFIGSLSKLQHLNLSDNLFVGRVPHQLGNLRWCLVNVSRQIF
ncbi:hypothetical protein LguiB_027350 [Lonicera macranthoides]